MQRVRIGLTGLSCVFLLVLLAAAFLGFVSDRPLASGGSRNEAGASAETNNSTEESPREPLAELGVAPGNGPDDGNAQGQ